jgi:uncharacterized Zn-binding protein involved in type VI secretion
MAALIVVGDRTSHGGVVIQGSPMTDTHGKSIARVGDRVTCPQKGHGGTTVIISGDPTLLIDGSAAARHGDKTACGATLLSSQVVTTDDAGGGASNALPTNQAAAVALAATAASQAMSKPSASTALGYDQHFLVKDEKTGKPLPNVPYKLTLETGREIKGTTDQNGLTEKIGADSELTAKLEVPYYGNSTSSANTHHKHDACGC